jgi:hypothetical protein
MAMFGKTNGHSDREVNKVRELLQILSSWLYFFLEPKGYRICDSKVFEGFGNASIVLERNELKWRLVRDRSQVFLDVRPPEGPDYAWYSLDLITTLLLGTAHWSEITAESARWVEENIDEIESRFHPTARAATVRKLKELQRRRSKALFKTAVDPNG